MKPSVMSPPPPIKPQHHFIHTTMPISDTYPPCHPFFPSHSLLFQQTTEIQLHCCSRELCDTLPFICIDTESITLKKTPTCFPPSSMFSERTQLVIFIMMEFLNTLRPLRRKKKKKTTNNQKQNKQTNPNNNLGKVHDLLHVQYHHNRLPLSRNP